MNLQPPIFNKHVHISNAKMTKRLRMKESDQPNLKRLRSEISGVAKGDQRIRRTKSHPKQSRKERRKEERHLKKLRKLAFSQRKPIPTKMELDREKREKEVEEKKAAKLKRQNAIKKEKRKRLAKKRKMAEEEKQREVEMADFYDDKVIKEMEKKLKLNKRKKDTLPKSFMDDGLDYILDVVDSSKLKDMANSSDLEDSDTEGDRLALYGVSGDVTDEDNSDNNDDDDDNDDDSDNDDDDDNDDDSEEGQEHEESDDIDNRIEVIESSEQTKTSSSILKKSKDSTVDKKVKWDIDDPNMATSSKGDRKRKLKESEDNEDKTELVIKQKKGNKLKTERSNIESDDSDNDDIDLSDSESDDNNSDYEDELDLDCDNSEMGMGSAEETGIVTGELKEDIYGRLRDEEGNIVKPSTPGAYVPPGKRLMMADNDEKKKIQLERLKKQLKGLVNRASESNIQPISSQIENLYMTNSRADVNETMISLMFESCVSPVLTPERLAMELIMLIAILHGNVGSEVGAVFLQHLMKKFDELYQLDGYGQGKEMDNVILLLSHLYNFKIVHSVLLFDVMKKLVSSFNEKDVELILLILKNVGFSLRKDDPVGLKSVIQEIQSKASSQDTAALTDQSRVRFMLDVIMAIRNNNMRKIPNYDPEHLEHLRKLIRNYIRGGHFGDNQLHITLEDLLKADEQGKWWVVGSAWSGQGPKQEHHVLKGEKSVIGGIEISSKLQELARKQRMNTDLRRNIFFVIMTSEDYIDAFEKLLRLGLKSNQQQEVVLVILDCCLQEKKYNLFYSYLGQKLCEHHRSYQMAFQFCIWDRFKELGQLTDSNRQNLGKLLTHLLASKALSLSLFKVVTFGTLEKPMVRLLKQVLTDILLEYPQTTTEAVFMRIAQLDKLKLLHDGLCLFLHHFVLGKRKSDDNYAVLKERIETVDKIFSSGKSHMLL